jgi:uncharacterized protein YegL
MPSLNDFVMQNPRPLPVIVAIDKSGSMSRDGKIDALNLALRDFVNSIKNEDSPVEIQLSLFSFGGNEAVCDLPLTPVDSVDVSAFEYKAFGKTPMGGAFLQIKALIEDKDQIPSRSYKPTIVLLSDGIPTDDYLAPMMALIQEGRSSKAFRIAMALGDDADRDMLGKFVSSPELLISGDSARDIKRFFRFVTMSVTSRMRSQTPDTPPQVAFPDDEVIF